MVMDPEVNMDNDEGSTVVPIAPRPRRKPAARKRPSAARKARPAATRSKSRTAVRRRPARPAGMESLIHSITGRVEIARAAIAEASGQGATAFRRAFGSASKASRRTVTRLANEWKGMDARKKARVLAALLGAAAAASAPLVRKSLKK